MVVTMRFWERSSRMESRSFPYGRANDFALHQSWKVGVEQLQPRHLHLWVDSILVNIKPVRGQLLQILWQWIYESRFRYDLNYVSSEIFARVQIVFDSREIEEFLNDNHSCLVSAVYFSTLLL